MFSLVPTVGWTGFNPLSLFAGGVQGAWYDPSDLATLFQDSGGTTPVTADGDPVGRMLDKSGNGWHLSQATSGSRPSFHTDGVLRWLTFDGTDDFLGSAASYAFALPEYIAACINKSEEATRGILGHVRSATTYHSLVNLSTNTRARHEMRGPGADSNVSSATASVPTGTAKVIDGLAVAGTNDIAINGGTPATGSNAFSSGDTDTGRTVLIGPRTALSGPATAMKWYGGLIVQADVSAKRVRIAKWLGAKGGLSL